MGDKEIAQRRFNQTGKEVKVTFMPQCTKCELNLGIDHCTEFNPKPADYKRNVKECPKFVEDS